LRRIDPANPVSRVPARAIRSPQASIGCQRSGPTHAADLPGNQGGLTQGETTMSSIYPDQASSRHAIDPRAALPGADPRAVKIRRLTSADLADALRLGWSDFKAVPSHALMLCLIYPLLGIGLARLVLGYAVLPLLFPLAAGFALLGPFAAIGLYELSRRRERGDSAGVSDALAVLRAPSFSSMLSLGGILMLLFLVWVATAQAIYVATFGYAPAAGIPDFVGRVVGSPEGALLIMLGCGVGFLFALAALCISVVSFPMMLDRQADATDAMLTSLRVVAANPAVMAGWGLIVAALLLIGSLPAFLGLTVVIPLLGHATWHLYRKAVV